jgi:hypothetical protein
MFLALGKGHNHADTFTSKGKLPRGWKSGITFFLCPKDKKAKITAVKAKKARKLLKRKAKKRSKK